MYWSSTSLTFIMFTVTVTWNGTAITGLVLIFQDELVRDDRTDVLATPRDGTVICRSENQAQVGWHFANGVLVSGRGTSNHYEQNRTSSSATPSVSRLSTNRPDMALTSAAANGLWTCRLNAGISTAFPVGIYARGGGEKYFHMLKLACHTKKTDLIHSSIHACMFIIRNPYRSWWYLWHPSLPHLFSV